jgi:hypothetical protein
MLKVSSFSLFIVSVLVCAAAPAQVTFPVPQPSLKVGELAKYRTIDLRTNREISKSEIELLELSDEKLLARLTSSAEPAPQQLVYNRFWNPCRSRQYSKKEVCDGALKFPMQVGAKHEYRALPWPNGAGHTSMKCEVKAEEQLTLTVGAIDTLRIECAGFWTDVIAARRYAGQTSEIQWYAPSFGRTVKSEFTSLWSTGQPDIHTRTELVEFLPGK